MSFFVLRERYKSSCGCSASILLGSFFGIFPFVRCLASPKLLPRSSPAGVPTLASLGHSTPPSTARFSLLRIWSERGRSPQVIVPDLPSRSRCFFRIILLPLRQPCAKAPLLCKILKPPHRSFSRSLLSRLTSCHPVVAHSQLQGEAISVIGRLDLRRPSALIRSFAYSFLQAARCTTCDC